MDKLDTLFEIAFAIVITCPAWLLVLGLLLSI